MLLCTRVHEHLQYTQPADSCQDCETILAKFLKMSYYFQSERHFSQSQPAKEGGMNRNIEAIFLDVGNTLRIVIEDPEFMAQARKDLMTLVGATQPESEFFDCLDARWKVYRKQSKESLLEASERELWTQWLLPDYPAETI